jgi:hypothetical protein
MDRETGAAGAAHRSASAVGTIDFVTRDEGFDAGPAGTRRLLTAP